MIVSAIFQTLNTLLWAYSIILFVRVIISWFRVDPYNPIVQFLYQITEPVLRPIRSVLPPVGMMDLSPLVAMIIVIVLRNVIGILAG